MAVQEVKEIDYYGIVKNFDPATKRDLGSVDIPINSKTYGLRILELSFVDYYMIKREYRGFCIQSTNTKREGKNPSLYPVVWKYEDGKTIVRKVHSVLGIKVPDGYVIDHLDGDTFNNNRSNLEVVTRAENTRRAQVKRGREV